MYDLSLFENKLNSKRIYTKDLVKLLKKDSVMQFIMGPRQVGKTTITHNMQESFESIVN